MSDVEFGFKIESYCTDVGFNEYANTSRCLSCGRHAGAEGSLLNGHYHWRLKGHHVHCPLKLGLEELRPWWFIPQGMAAMDSL